MNFDIDSIAESTQNTFQFTVGFLPATGDTPPEPVGFVVLGPNSDEYQKAKREASILGVKEAERRKKPLDLSQDEDAGKFVDSTEFTRQIALKHCVVGWYGWLSGDKPAEFTQENLAKVLKARPALAERILAAIENSANFDVA